MWGSLAHIFLFRILISSQLGEALEDLVREALTPLGFELVEYRRGGTRSRPLVEVRVDRLDGEAVLVDDCARASRAIEALLDGSGLLPERYVLEVSSPGVERPLLTAAHWRRFVGRQVSVKSAELGSRAEYRLEAVHGDEGSEEVVLVDAKGVEHRVPLSAIAEARLAFHWKR
jgi:ribosome maturation factor RimP